MKRINLFISKKYIVSLLLMAFILFSCNSAGDVENTEIKFENSQYDFGEIAYNKVVFAKIRFKNEGKQPLIIKKIESSCGCTIAKYDQKVIEPTHFGEFQVLYDAKSIGRFKKNIYVFYNGFDSPVKITIKGEVEYLSLLD